LLKMAIDILYYFWHYIIYIYVGVGFEHRSSLKRKLYYSHRDSINFNWTKRNEKEEKKTQIKR
jgi:hypothetical protein